MRSTNPDPAAAGSAIPDEVIRFRVLGSEQVFDLETAERWVLGSSAECTLRLDDPSGRVSRQHALAVRKEGRWMLRDLDSTNGLRLNREERQAFELSPGDELELGGITLIAESRASIALHAFLRRLLGGAPSRLGEVDRAAREVRELAAGRGALVLLGAGSLAGVARRLHRLALPARPLVALGQGEAVSAAYEQAAGGVLFIDARRLPRDLDQVTIVRADVRLMVGAAAPEQMAPLAELMPRMATISIPPLHERADEIEALAAAYAQEAAADLGAPALELRPGALAWARSSWIATLADVEDAARRVAALRTWGVTVGAARLGMTHGALSRWARRRGIPT